MFTKILTNLLEVLIISAAIILLTFIFIGQPLVITGDSMLPNLKDGEQIIADKLSIKFKDIKRGEVIIVTHPEKPQIFLVKRVVGVPKDTFKIINGKVLINEVLLEEPYIDSHSTTNGGNKIKEGEAINLNKDMYIVLGDNRENSIDSRNWGTVSKTKIIGRAFIVYYPLNSIRLVR